LYKRACLSLCSTGRSDFFFFLDSERSSLHNKKVTGKRYDLDLKITTAFTKSIRDTGQSLGMVYPTNASLRERGTMNRLNALEHKIAHQNVKRRPGTPHGAHALQKNDDPVRRRLYPSISSGDSY
jgi:hypothetical protein